MIKEIKSRIMTKQMYPKHWWNRLVSPTSEDFRWLRKRANYIGATTLAILGISTIVTLPAWVAVIAPYILIACISITGTASFTKEPTHGTDSQAQ